jgi:hypothetical protein
MVKVESKQGTVCHICLHRIDDGQPVNSCPDCQSLYHGPCWEDLGGCAIYGCPGMVEVKKGEDEGTTVWGMSEKVCPACAEKIPATALACPFCRTKFDEILPMAREELLRQPDDPEVVSYRRKAIWLLIFSLIGVTSPLTLLIGGIWYWSKKGEIERAGTTVKGITLIALVISVAYIVLVGFGLLVFSLKGADF